MLSASYLVFGLALLAPLISADGPEGINAVCTFSSETKAIDPTSFEEDWRDFCNDLERETINKSNQSHQTTAYGLTKGDGFFSWAYNVDTPCQPGECVEAYEDLVTGCELSNKNVTGEGENDASCGTFKFSVSGKSTPKPLTTSVSSTSTSTRKSTSTSSGGAAGMLMTGVPLVAGAGAVLMGMM